MFRTPQEAIGHLNKAANKVQEMDTTMTTTIMDHNTNTEFGQNFKKTGGTD